MRCHLYDLRKCKYIPYAVRVVCIMLFIGLLFSIISNAYFTSDGYIETLLSETEKNLFIIDAGHGGEDPGAIGVNGMYEKDLNLAVANEIGTLLTEHGYAVIYTRKDDRLLYTEEENIRGIRKISDLKNRCKIAAEYPNSIFISIHMNSFGMSKYSGTQTYYAKYNEGSEYLASCVQSSVKNNLQPTNTRKIKEGKDIYVLENINNVGILIECGFLTNSEECEKLSEKEYQKRLSLAIVCGIIEYKESVS